MKISIALSALILMVASFFGWQDHTRLTTLRTTHETLVAEATALGVSPEFGPDGKPLPMTKRQRQAVVDKAAVAKAFAAQLADFGKEMKNHRGGDDDEEMQARVFAIIDQMMKLDPSQLKILVAELQARTDLDDDMREGIIGFAIMTLASDHPQAALALFTESSGKIKMRGMSEHVMRSSLAKWAETDSAGALEWVRKNASLHPDLVTDSTKMGLLQGTASQNPKLAFQLMDELGIKDRDMVGRDLADAARTPAERTAVLEALRDKVATMDPALGQSLLNSVVRSLGMKAVGEGFEAGSAWLQSANLGESEKQALAVSFQYYSTKDDTGKWLSWMGSNLPAQLAESRVKDLVPEWTRQDYKAAGAWINGEPAGPAKNAAVSSYAATVAPFEPATAAQWALTLPAGEERQKLIDQIHTEWQKKDAAAAAVFARQQGLGQIEWTAPEGEDE